MSQKKFLPTAAVDFNAGQKLWQKLGNPAGLNTILNILLASNIISAPPSPNINVEIVAHSQTNTSRTTLKLGEGGSSEMSLFLLKNTHFDAFAKLFCPPLLFNLCPKNSVPPQKKNFSCLRQQ